jgi:SET domain-containing protein
MTTADRVLADMAQTYVQLKPSPISGVGVFAIRDIPKGTKNIFTKDTGEWMKIPVEKLKGLPAEVREMIDNYCLFDDGFFYLEDTGFKKMDLVSFLNHSTSPNMMVVNDGEYFESSRDIAMGEELLLRYDDLWPAASPLAPGS